jgi:hypothetical protein
MLKVLRRVSHFLIVMLNVAMLSVVMLCVVMLNVVMLNVNMLSVVAPHESFLSVNYKE